MKHVSRVLFGFSIVAVLALFTACPQASSPKKDTPNPNPLGLDQKQVAKLISGLSGISGNFDINQDSGAITLKKDAVETITLPKKLSDDLTLKDVKVTKGSSVTSAASGDQGFTLTVKKPTSNKAEIVTLQLTVEGKDKNSNPVTSVFDIVVTNKKGVDANSAPSSEDPVIGAITMAAGTQNHEVTFTSVAVTGGEADAYTAVKVTAAKKDGDKKAVKINANAEYSIAKDAIAKKVTLTLSKAEDSDPELTAGDTYVFTFQLVKGSANVGTAKTAEVKSGTN